mmetsp:Transcript_119609/g.371831  ORF Transcript_119609/g.371831 Transcript_119609/m.371831 type:complete len:308 (-) Transcript_119609:704-1627(-)
MFKETRVPKSSRRPKLQCSPSEPPGSSAACLWRLDWDLQDDLDRAPKVMVRALPSVKQDRPVDLCTCTISAELPRESGKLLELHLPGPCHNAGLRASTGGGTCWSCLRRRPGLLLEVARVLLHVHDSLLGLQHQDRHAAHRHREVVPSNSEPTVALIETPDSTAIRNHQRRVLVLHLLAGAIREERGSRPELRVVHEVLLCALLICILRLLVVLACIDNAGRLLRHSHVASPHRRLAHVHLIHDSVQRALEPFEPPQHAQRQQGDPQHVARGEPAAVEEALRHIPQARFIRRVRPQPVMCSRCKVAD